MLLSFVALAVAAQPATDGEAQPTSPLAPILSTRPMATPGPQIEAPYEPGPPINHRPTPTQFRGYTGTTDYPREALRNDEQGTAYFRIIVGRDGRVSDCMITGSSGSHSLDDATCRLLIDRAHFTPARDRNGNPVEDVVESHFTWRLTSGRESRPN